MKWYDMIWYDLIRDDMIWYGMIWYGMIWYGMIWYDIVWYDMIWYVMIDEYDIKKRIPKDNFKRNSSQTLSGIKTVISKNLARKESQLEPVRWHSIFHVELNPYVFSPAREKKMQFGIVKAYVGPFSNQFRVSWATRMSDSNPDVRNPYVWVQIEVLRAVFWATISRFVGIQTLYWGIKATGGAPIWTQTERILTSGFKSRC